MTNMHNKSHMQACLEEHVRSWDYKTDKEKKGQIFLDRIHLDEGGYSKATGKYYGIGAPLFSVYIEPEGETEVTWTAIMRGSNESGTKSRNALRAELQKLYPNMKVCR